MLVLVSHKSNVDYLAQARKLSAEGLNSAGEDWLGDENDLPVGDVSWVPAPRGHEQLSVIIVGDVPGRGEFDLRTAQGEDSLGDSRAPRVQ